MKKVKQAGSNESTKAKRFWIEEEDDEQQPLQLCTQTRRWKAIAAAPFGRLFGQTKTF